LSERSPNHPVVLFHASGHALFANQAAMDAAGISADTPDPEGGAILRDLNGEAIGVFEERAMRPIREAYQQDLETLPEEARRARWDKAIELAQEECLSKGITSFQDAGSTLEEIERYRQMADLNQLRLRLWAMVRHNSETLEGQLDGFPILHAGQYAFTCRAMKSEVDGALGAFGAWLLRPYHDKPGFEGQNTTPVSEVRKLAEMAKKHGLQFCVHAIGDRANRVVLDLFEEQLEPGNDLRWRVEHAQHLNPQDIPRFKELGAIASMQGIHCTSDAPFVERRLGEQRSREGAYAWRSLIDAGVLIANGTDAPVEDVDPLKSFYASVTRRREDNGLVFYPEQRMTREEALYSYTRWNAFAAFEEDIKGSLEPGKLADLVVLSENLLSCPDEAILEARVLLTMVGGVVQFKAADARNE
jgi:predicted amidohydrolase YtcJ